MNAKERILNMKTLQQAVLSSQQWNDSERILFVCGEREVSFAEYEAVTAHLAKSLVKRGMYPGKTVALCMKRTEKLFLALYGIIKSGAALLPIPEDMPTKRVQDIYQQISVDLTITDDVYEELLADPVYGSETVVYAKPEDTALILFTSGSTGRPRGVLHTQESTLGFMVQFPLDIEEVGIPCGGFDTVIAKTNINFVSAYLFEIPMALFHAKKVVILNQEEQNSVRCVGRMMEQYNNTCIFLTPSQIESYLKSDDFCRQFKALHTLILAGEHTSEKILHNIVRQADSALCILNVYGSTECGLILCQNEREDDYNCMRLMPDTQLQLIDEKGQLVERGKQGEIVVSSKHQFLKYAGVDARVIQENGISYFCTGDIGVRNAEGFLEIQGRRDRMVKYHGMRVELADIEQNICRFPGISECAVVVGRSERGVEILSAYYVCAEGEKVNISQLRRFLTDYLPVTLIPVGMVQLDQIPLNANGKRDYKELENRPYVPEQSHNTQGAGNPQYTEILCRVVSEVTGERALPEDNLFRLGMDSLMAFHIISELGEAGLTVSVGEIFENPILSDLAELLQKAQGSDEMDAADRYPATGVQIYWGTEIDFNKKSRGLYVTEDFLTSAVYNEEKFCERVHTLLRKHPALRMQAFFENGMPSQTIRSMEEICISSVKKAGEGAQQEGEKSILCLVDYADLRNLQDDTAGDDVLGSQQKTYIENFKKQLMNALIGIEGVVSFEAACFQVRDDASVIVITGNHASIDGASMNILIQEMICKELDYKEDCYRQYLAYIGRKENIERGIGFYTQYLKNVEFSAFPEVETKEGEGEPMPVFKGATLSLGEKGTRKLYEQSLKEKVSPVGYLMFTYGKSLLEALDKEALVMQILTFGRGIPVRGMDQAVGCFIEYVPVVIRKEDTASDFQNGNLLTEQNSFVPLPVIWKQACGLEMPPKLAPFLISEIFPEITADGMFRKLSEMDYEKMFMGNFIVKRNDEIKIYFHFNAAKILEKSFRKVTDAMQRRLTENGMMEV